MKTTKTEAFMSATGLPLMLYRRQFGVMPVVVSGDQDAVAIDVAAALTADRRALTIGVVNPNDEEKTIRLAIKAAGVSNVARVWQITGPDPGALNSPDKRPVTLVGPEEVPFDGTLTAPPYSVSLYRMRLE